jgi:hypothetical protein
VDFGDTIYGRSQWLNKQSIRVGLTYSSTGHSSVGSAASNAGQHCRSKSRKLKCQVCSMTWGLTPLSEKEMAVSRESFGSSMASTRQMCFAYLTGSKVTLIRHQICTHGYRFKRDAVSRISRHGHMCCAGIHRSHRGSDRCPPAGSGIRIRVSNGSETDSITTMKGENHEKSIWSWTSQDVE